MLPEGIADGDFDLSAGAGCSRRGSFAKTIPGTWKMEIRAKNLVYATFHNQQSSLSKTILKQTSYKIDLASQGSASCDMTPIGTSSPVILPYMM